MHLPLCDFYDWTRHRTCHRPATWVTHQQSLGAPRPVGYYCDAHRPPRARPLTDSTPPEGTARPDAVRPRKKP